LWYCGSSRGRVGRCQSYQGRFRKPRFTTRCEQPRHLNRWRGFCLPRNLPGPRKPPMISPMVRWAIAFAACVALVMLSVVFIDRPVAIFFRDLELPERRIGLVLDTLLLLPALGAAALCMAAFRTWRGIAVPSWLALFSRAGLGCLCAFAINDFALKPLFGRYTVGQFMTFPHPYGFVPFGGNLLSGFPSGHAALVVGFL